MKKFKLLSSFLAAVMVLSMLTVVPVSAEERIFDGPYDFEDVVTAEPYNDPNDGQRREIEDPVAEGSYVTDFFRSVKSTTGQYGIQKYAVQSGESNSEYATAEGSVIAARTNTPYYLLDNIDTDIGVETYEFDFFYGHGSTDYTVVLTCQDTNSALLPANKLTTKGNTIWKHMTIEYDTVNDTLSVSVDGTVINTLEDVTTFDKPLLMTNNQGLGIGSRARIFRMDNYKSYLTYEAGASMSGLDITMEDGSEITLPGDTGAEGISIKVTANAVNTYAEPQDVTVIYAFYKDDELVDATSKPVTVPADQFDAKEISVPFTTEADVEFDTVKAFVWDDLGAALSKSVAVSYQAQ